MNLNDPRITILVSGERVTIEMRDTPSSIVFLHVEMTAEQFATALGRQCDVRCFAEVAGLNVIGKQMEHKTFEFPMTRCDWKSQVETAKRIVKKKCPRGWQPDMYFGSADSFFTKEGKPWARCTIRRYVEMPQLAEAKEEA